MAYRDRLSSSQTGPIFATACSRSIMSSAIRMAAATMCDARSGGSPAEAEVAGRSRRPDTALEGHLTPPDFRLLFMGGLVWRVPVGCWPGRVAVHAQICPGRLSKGRKHPMPVG